MLLLRWDTTKLKSQCIVDNLVHLLWHIIFDDTALCIKRSWNQIEEPTDDSTNHSCQQTHCHCLRWLVIDVVQYIWYGHCWQYVFWFNFAFFNSCATLHALGLRKVTYSLHISSVIVCIYTTNLVADVCSLLLVLGLLCYHYLRLAVSSIISFSLPHHWIIKYNNII